MPELDSLRGVAILLVLFFHGFGFQFGTAPLPRLAHLFVIATMPGWIGVNLFFVLSGFLITGILIESRNKTNYYRNFYLRRALRILPAYYALLLLLWVSHRSGWLDHREISWQFIALSSIYLSNITNLLGVPLQYAALWTLAVEEHFYLLWPAVVRSLSQKALAISALAIVLLCPMLRAIAYERGYQYGAGYTWLVADGLAIGSLLCLLSRGWLADRKRMQRASISCIVAGVALLTFGAPFGILLGRTLLGGTVRVTALNLFFAGALGAVLLVGTSPRKRIVQRPLLTFFGRISYGLYLIHMLAFGFVDHFFARYVQDPLEVIQGSFALICLRFAVAGTLAIVIALLSRNYFEEWSLRLKDRWSAKAANQLTMLSLPKLVQAPTLLASSVHGSNSNELPA